MPAWKLITNHGAVLILLAQHGRITVRELAHRLGLTERLIHRIIAELAAEGYVSKQRVGRGNQYQVHPNRPLLRPVFRGVTVGEWLRGVRVTVQAPPAGQASPSRNAGGRTAPQR